MKASEAMQSETRKAYWATVGAAAVLLFASSFDAAAARTLRPVDAGSAQADFAAFRAEMKAAIERRDSAALLAMLDPDIKASFGGDDGVERFSEMWRLDSPDSRLWETLSTVLALGGTFTEPDTFTAPYVFATWPEEIDAFENTAIVGRGVRVRAAASLESAPLTSLSYAIVALADRNADSDAWIAVRLADGRAGFVSRRYVRSPLDYRAIFQRTGDGWRLRAFVAGD